MHLTQSLTSTSTSLVPGLDISVQMMRWNVKFRAQCELFVPTFRSKADCT